MTVLPGRSAKIRPMSDSLTPRQQRFVEEYLAVLNGAEAARRAGYSPRSAKVRACRLMKKPAVGKLIREALAERHRQYLMREAEYWDRLRTSLDRRLKLPKLPRG